MTKKRFVTAVTGSYRFDTIDELRLFSDSLAVVETIHEKALSSMRGQTSGLRAFALVLPCFSGGLGGCCPQKEGIQITTVQQRQIQEG